MQLRVKDNVEPAEHPVKARLEAMLREAEEKLQRLDERVHDRPDLGPGEASAVGYSWEMALARKTRVAARIEALREALARVDVGTYGSCDRCGQQIDPERLEILPTTTLCAACCVRTESEDTPCMRLVQQCRDSRSYTGRDRRFVTTMPKMKTHKGFAKRFKLTGKGKLQRRKQGGTHLRRKKSKRVRRSYSQDQPVSGADQKRLRRLGGLKKRQRGQ